MTQDQRTLAEIYIQEGKYKEGIEIYRELRAAHPDDDSLVMSLAWAYQDSGERDRAIACLEALLEKELTGSVFTAFAFDELVRIYRDESLHEKLVSLCERVVAAYPGDAALLITLGNACLLVGKTKRAIEVFEMLTEMEPDASVHFCSLGKALIAAGRLREGMNAYERAVLVDPDDAHTFFDRLGHVLNRFGHVSEAEEAVNRSIGIDSGNPATHCSLGDILIRQGKVREGTASYERAIGLDPASPGSYYNRLGIALADCGHHRDAVEAFGKALAAEPGNPFYSMRLSEASQKAALHDESIDIESGTQGTR